MKYTIVAVGSCARPTSTTPTHYAKLLRGHARVEVVELKEDADVARRLPGARRTSCCSTSAAARTTRPASPAGWRTAARPAATSASSSAARPGSSSRRPTSGSRSAR